MADHTAQVETGCRAAPARWPIRHRRGHGRAGPRRRSAAGAVGVEYALALALVVVGITAGLRMVEGGLREEASDKRALGAPDVELPVGTVPQSSTSSTTTPPDSPPLDEYEVRIREPITWAVGRSQGNRWTATVTIEVVRASDGQPFGPAVTVTGRWTGAGVTDASCETGVNGSCPMSLTSLHHHVDQITFEVTGVHGSSVIPPASYPAPIVIARPL